MVRHYWRQALFYTVCFVLATLLVWSYYFFLPDIVRLQRRLDLQRKTEQLAAIVVQYQKGKPSYQPLEVGNFENVNLPKGLYRYFNDIDLEDVDGGRIEVFSGTTSHYQLNNNAFVILWSNINSTNCSLLAQTKWNNIKGARVLGFAINKDYDHYDEMMLFNGCSGGEGVNGAVVACNNGKIRSFPLDAKSADEACNCYGYNCFFALKYM